MEKIDGEINKSISTKYRDLDSYWDEAIKIMNRLKYNFLTYDNNNISSCVEAIIRAEIDFKPYFGTFSTFKFNYVKTECKHIVYKQHTKKYIGNKKLVSKVSRVSSPEDIFDFKVITSFIYHTPLLSHKQRMCFIDYYINGMSITKIASENKFSRQNTHQLIKKAMKVIKEKFYV